MVLEGVVSMRLLELKNGGRVPAVEIMMATPTVKQLLAEGKTQELYTALKDGQDYFGTCTFNQSLKTLVERDVVTIDQALAAADNPDELKLEFRGLRKGNRSGDFEFETFKRK
jgi:twitching motility protein PilT